MKTSTKNKLWKCIGLMRFLGAEVTGFELQHSYGDKNKHEGKRKSCLKCESAVNGLQKISNNNKEGNNVDIMKS